MLGLMLLASLTTLGQGIPPVVVTNIIRLNPSTRLLWDSVPGTDIAGYWAQMSQGTNVWRMFTTNTAINLVTLNPAVSSGAYSFQVAAVNLHGLEGQPSTTLATNLSRQPGMVVNQRLEFTFVP